jgi:hypothetical protein
MDGAAPTPSEAPQYTPRQLGLMRELASIGKKYRFSEMFRGALVAMANGANPEGLVQAAHSLRELMEKLEGEKSIPLTGKSAKEGAGSLGDRTRVLLASWKTVKVSSTCLKHGTWSGEIDPPLLTLFEQLDSHDIWFESNPKFRKQKAQEIVGALDPLSTLLPQDVQDAQAAEWKSLKNYFTEVSHHKEGASRETMEASVAALERFLHSRVATVVAEHHMEIQKLIEEGEGDGN